jgi:hypothetical protein
MPLLTTAFERAVQLAESMESRGLSGELSGLSVGQLRALRALMALGLALMLVGLVLRVIWIELAGTALIALGGAILVYAFWALGRHVRRTRFSRQRWGRPDTMIALCSLGALAAGVVSAYSAPGVLAYAPLAGGPLLPAFNTWLGLAFALLAVPGLMLASQTQTEPDVAGPDGSARNEAAL